MVFSDKLAGANYKTKRTNCQQKIFSTVIRMAIKFQGWLKNGCSFFQLSGSYSPHQSVDWDATLKFSAVVHEVLT